MKRAVIIMAKIPRAGNVKTRLQPRLTPAQSADFAACLLADAIKKVKSPQTRLVIAFAPAAEREYFNGFSLPEAIFTEQKGSDLGEKMFNAFDFAFRRGANSAVIIGTDSPTFPADFIERAFADLEKSDAVLGKTADGGFYLLGLKKSNKAIFKSVEWSSEKTFRQTMENILRLNLELKEIPEWYDVDEPPDLERLQREFARNAVSRSIAPRTFEWMRANL